MTGKFIYEHTTYALSVGFSGTPNWIPSTTTTTTVTNCIDVYFIVVLISCAGTDFVAPNGARWGGQYRSGIHALRKSPRFTLHTLISQMSSALLMLDGGGVLQLQNAVRRFAGLQQSCPKGIRRWTVCCGTFPLWRINHGTLRGLHGNLIVVQTKFMNLCSNFLFQPTTFGWRF